MVQGVEAIVVGDGDVSAGLQQHGQHVITLLADGVVQGCVTLRVLQGATLSQPKQGHQQKKLKMVCRL